MAFKCGHVVLKSNYQNIGDFIQLVDNRNKELLVDTLLGLTINKIFIPSVANTVGTNMKNYKIIKKNQFACSLMQVRRDKKMPVALLKYFDQAIISQAYPVFEIIDTKLLLPEYLMMWFSRSEFDRHACFLAVGGVRGSLEWEDFLDMKLPVPCPQKQAEIVAEYNTITNRIKLNEQLNQKLEETAQAIYKHWFVDFEFPDEDGKPYKSNGGKMVYCDELEKEIPQEWENGYLKDLVNFSSKRIHLSLLNKLTYISTENMLQGKKGVSIANSLPNVKTVTKFENGNVLISNIRPYFKKIWLAEFQGGCSNDILCLEVKKRRASFFVYSILEQDVFFDYVMKGAKGTKMPRGDKAWIMKYKVIIPNNIALEQFNNTLKFPTKLTRAKKEENKILKIFSELLLSKLSTNIEN